MLNKLYGRGVCDALQQAGLAKFANEKIALEAADAVSDAVLPEEVPGEVAPETTAVLANNLMELSQALEEGASHAADAAEAAAGPEGAAPEGIAPEGIAPEGVKNAAAWLCQKIAEGTGTMITGTDPGQKNTLENSVNSEAQLDTQNRPGGAGYANVGVQGVGIQQASGQGAIGSEKEHPGSMGPVDVQNSNSVIEAIKGASLRRLITKLSEGTTLMPNASVTPDAETGEGKLDDANRPGGAGYANKGVAGVGQSEQAAKARAAAIGTEGAHPGTMGPVGQGGTNTVIQQIPNTKQGSAEQTYLRNFQEVADKYAAYLPIRLTQEEKIAAVKYFLSQEPVVRDRMAMHMQKTAEMPAGLAEYVAKEKGEGKKDEGKKDEGKKDEGKKDEDKKDEDKEKEGEKTSSADILARVRNLIAGA